MAAMAAVPSYAPSVWVKVCHALPRLDLTMQMRDNFFVPDSWEYQQVKLHTQPITARHQQVTSRPNHKSRVLRWSGFGQSNLHVAVDQQH